MLDTLAYNTILAWTFMSSPSRRLPFIEVVTPKVLQACAPHVRNQSGRHPTTESWWHVLPEWDKTLEHLHASGEKRRHRKSLLHGAMHWLHGSLSDLLGPTNGGTHTNDVSFLHALRLDVSAGSSS